VLVVKGLRNYPHVQRAEGFWGREIASGREMMAEGFPYLNSKYLASRAATSPSGSQSDFRDPRGGRRSQSRDLSRTKRSNVSHLPRLSAGKPRSRDLSDLRRGPFRRSIRMRIEIGTSGLIEKNLQSCVYGENCGKAIRIVVFFVKRVFGDIRITVMNDEKTANKNE